MDEYTFDALLAEWMTDGADTAPDRIAELAVLEVTTTRQESTRMLRGWAWMYQSPVTRAAAILALAIGIGLLLRAGSRRS